MTQALACFHRLLAKNKQNPVDDVAAIKAALLPELLALHERVAFLQADNERQRLLLVRVQSDLEMCCGTVLDKQSTNDQINECLARAAK